MKALVLQVVQLPPVLRGVREHFQHGGSTVVALLIVVGIGALTLTTFWLARWVRRQGEACSRVDDPARLFSELLDNLGLSNSQRRVLMGIAGELRLAHPTTMLLSPTLFDHYVDKWLIARRTQSDVGDNRRARTVSQVRSALFPTATPVVEPV
ncbi:MAG: hypothetical protein ACE5HE_05190 [Phycisphaerae bacterium]